MVELRVPRLADRPFEAHFQALIRQSLLRSAEAEYAYHRGAGHGLRARRAAGAIDRLKSVQWEPGANVALPRLGPGIRYLTRVVWGGCVVVLALVTARFGIHSWATGAADLGLIAVTFAWFAVSWASDVRRPRS